MFAPVYRHLDAPSTFLGLAFPMEWLAVLGAGWVGTALGAPNVGAAAALGIYLVIRIAGHGRAEGHLQHWLQWRVRQAVSVGRLSAAARARSPRFPFGPYLWRDGLREGRP
jgi:hypothetical protein